MFNHARGTIAFAAISIGLIPSGVVAQENSQAVSELSFDLNGRYDSNIARSSAARAALRGLEQADYVLSPTVTINLARPVGPHRISVRGTLGYNFHARNSQLDRERIGIETGLDLALGPCRLDTTARINRQQSDLADIAFFTATPIDTVRNTETIQSYSGNLSCGDRVGLRPLAGIEYQTARNSAVSRDRAEYDSVRYETGVQYVSPTIGKISLFASRRDVDLVSQRLIAGPQIGRNDGYRVTEYGVRFSRDIGTRLQLDTSAARSELASRNSAVRGTSGFVWNGQLTALLGSRLRATLATGRQISNSLASDATYVISRPSSLRLTYAVNDRMQIDAGGSITARRYNYAFVPTTDVIERETRRIYDAGVSYTAGRNWRLRASVGRDQRNANGTVFDYRGTFATASVGFRF